MLKDVLLIYSLYCVTNKNYQLDLDYNNNQANAIGKILNKIITLQEVRKAIKKLKTGKSAGEDKILNECLRVLEPCLVLPIIRWRSISMRAGPAFLQFDWSKAGLSMDLPVFIYSHTKTSFRFLSRQRKYREAFYVVTDLLLQATQREPYRALVLSRLRLSRSTDHQDRNLHSS